MVFERFRCLLAVVVLAAASPVFAAPTSTDVETARNLMDVGRNRYDVGDYAGALEAFQGADALVGVTSTGLWTGKALMKLGRLIEARGKLYEVSQLPVASDENEVIAEARREADALQRELADRIPELTIALSGLHAEAQPTVLIDGEVVEQATLELPRKIDPGDHLARATAQGYHDVELRFSVAETERQRITLTFTPNGEPLTDPPPPPVTSEAGISPLVWAGVGVAGAGIVVGAIAGGLSLSAASEARDLCRVDLGPCAAADAAQHAEAKNRAEESTVLAHVSTAAFAVAGIGAALMVTGFILASEEGEDGATVEARIGPTGFGLSGRF